MNGLNSGRMPSQAALAKAGQQRRQRGQPGEAGEGGDADHRRDQHQPVGPRQRAGPRARPARISSPARRRWNSRRCAAAGRGRPARAPPAPPAASPPASPPSSPRSGRPAPCRAPGRRGAERDEAALPVALGDMAQAVGRIGQPVQEAPPRPAARPSGSSRKERFQSCAKRARMHRAAGEVAVGGTRSSGSSVSVTFAPHGVEGGVLGREVARPVGGIERRRPATPPAPPGARAQRRAALDMSQTRRPSSATSSTRPPGRAAARAGVWSGSACASVPRLPCASVMPFRGRAPPVRW